MTLTTVAAPQVRCSDLTSTLDGQQSSVNNILYAKYMY